MKTTELTPKATEDLESIWLYSYEQFGLTKADEYISRFSDVFEILSRYRIGTFRPELGDRVYSLPVEQHVIFFIPAESIVTVIRILSQSQEATRHFPWR